MAASKHRRARSRHEPGQRKTSAHQRRGRGALRGAPAVPGNGFASAAVNSPGRTGEQWAGFFSKRERDVIITGAFWQLCLTPTPCSTGSSDFPPAESQAHVKQRKGRNYPFTGFLFQLLIPAVISRRVGSLFFRSQSCRETAAQVRPACTLLLGFMRGSTAERLGLSSPPGVCQRASEGTRQSSRSSLSHPRRLGTHYTSRLTLIGKMNDQ